MSKIVTDAGGQLFLNVLFGATVKPTSFTLQLLTDAIALSDQDINTTHTEADGGGYAEKALSNNATVANSASGIPIATWAAQAFTFTGALTGNPDVTGYQMLSGTTLLFAEKLATAYTPAINGDSLTITPSFVMGNGNPT